jgi:hypothetical protein
MADRAALISPDVTPPRVGPPGTPRVVDLYAMYLELTKRVFVDAVGDLFRGHRRTDRGLLLRSNVRQRPARTAPAAPTAPLAEAPLPAEPEFTYAERHERPVTNSGGSPEAVASNRKREIRR